MNVVVTAKAGANGDVDWAIDGKHPKESSLEFPPKTGPHTIVFHLDDQTGRNLRFHDSSPFSAEKNNGGNCPSKGAQCDQTRVQPGGEKTLVVMNANSGDPCTINYQLTFVDGTGKSEDVDPEIKNGGGSLI